MTGPDMLILHRHSQRCSGPGVVALGREGGESALKGVKSVIRHRAQTLSECHRVLNDKADVRL